jgi:hypothetical protein
MRSLGRGVVMENKGALCMTVEERRHHADLAEESCHVGSPVNCLEISWLLKKRKIRREKIHIKSLLS